MNPPGGATLGALLIVVGLAFALLAFAILLNRRGGKEDGSREIEAEQIPSSEPEQDEIAELSREEVGDGDETLADELPATEADEELARSAPEPPAGEVEAPAPRELIRIAELYREEVSGVLVVRIGDQEFRSADEITKDRSRRKIQYASADLAHWFAGSAPSDRAQKPMPEPELAAVDDAAAGGKSTNGEERVARRDMLDGINSYLNQKLAQIESGPRGVRLVADASGGVRVLIGVKSYSMEEVPDEAIRELIRQAVEAWEASQ